MRGLLPSCLLLLLSTCGGEPESSSATVGPTDPPNVLMFVVDTLRADRLGCYGHDAPTSPHLDSFAEQAQLFERAWAPSPYTATSHASLFTSTYPETHGIWNRLQLDSKPDPVFPALPEKAITLAEVFRDSGWQTAAIAGGGYVNARRGLAQGFELFDSRTLGAEDRMNRALQWLGQERDPNKPFFLFLHTYEVHYPYVPPKEYVNRFASDYQGPLHQVVEQARTFNADFLRRFPDRNPIGEVQRRFFKPLFDSPDFDQKDRDFVHTLYDAEIAVVDDQFARLEAMLQETGLAENTIVIVTSDHGEELWEHDYFGHHRVWEETMHIPLLIRHPQGPIGVRRSDSVDLVDLMPTLLAAVGLPLPAQVAGRVVSLTSLEPEGVGPGPSHVHQANWPAARAAWRNDSRKVHFFPDEGFPPQVYDLGADPGERQDLANTESGRISITEARRALDRFRKAAVQRRKDFGLLPVIHAISSFTPEVVAELQGLGYVEAEED